MSRRNRLLAAVLFACAGLAAPAAASARTGGIQAWRVTGAHYVSALSARPMTITFALARATRAPCTPSSHAPTVR